MMENMRLQEGDIVILRNTSLPEGNFVKLQPHTKDFLDISNPKAMYKLNTTSCCTFHKSHNCVSTNINIFFLPFGHFAA